jgi:small subunit ribosomal protein S16
MLKIKLARFGKKKQPHYRIVINEARDKRDGKYVEMIGQYAPTLTPKVLNIDIEKLETWLKKGAQPTDTVQALIARFKSGNPFPAKKNILSKKAKAKKASAEQSAKDAKEAEAQAAANPAPEATEAPAETPTEASTEVTASTEAPAAPEAAKETPAA